MARLKAPLLGMDASGPLGKNLTFSHVKGMPIVKRSPWHPDARTLPQLYQRWRYYDAVQYWHSLTTDQKAAYHVLGRPYHQTGYQHLISLYLQNPLDQVLWLRLDTADPTTVPDFSKKDNHGTLFGPTLVPSKIDNCRSFDGIDDKITVPHSPTLNFTVHTMMAWVKIPDQTSALVVHGLFYKGLSYDHGFQLFMVAAPDPFYPRLSYGGPSYPHSIILKPDYLDIWLHIAGTFDGSKSRVLFNGILKSGPLDDTWPLNDFPLYLGGSTAGRFSK